MTIRQWIDTLKDVPNMKFGIKMANGIITDLMVKQNGLSRLEILKASGNR